MAKILYGLVSCGIVEWKQDGAERPASGRGGFHGLNVEVAAQPSDRSPGHAELVKNTYRRIDWLTHYELLGVVREAPPEKISEAYFERSRLFHPDLRHREDLARFEKELTAVFERMKKAYETLSDPDKRALYDQSLDAAPAPVLDGRGRPRDAQEAGDAEFPARPPAHRGQGLSPGRRDAARGRALRSRQRRVPLRPLAGRAEEPELDRPGAREPEGGRAPRQPPGRLLRGGGARAARVQAPAGGRALRAARGLARSVAGERGAAARASSTPRPPRPRRRPSRARPSPRPRPRSRPRRPPTPGLLSRLFRHRG